MSLRLRFASLLGVAILMLGTPGFVSAEENPGQAAAAMSPQNLAQLRAEWFQILSALAAEQAKPQPDQARLAELQAQLAALRVKVGSAMRPGVVPGAPVPCPWGGPGLGMGMGRGPGYAMGMGAGRGPAAGYGQVPGGPGQGRGRGRGFGGGAAFVDQNRNGICDYYELRWGW